jgi:peptide/nickel transport system ATP-binding protein
VTLLSLEHLHTDVVSHRGTAHIVRDVSLEIERNEAVALVGESGCGKSMTATSIIRLVRPPGRIAAGRVVFEGRDLGPLPEPEMRRVRGARIAMIFQDPMTYLNPLMRVGDQIGEALRLHGRYTAAELQAGVVEALRRVRIPDPADAARYYPHQLSGGMRQRVLIAIAIAGRPSLLIADEPTTALDVTVQAQILELLQTIRAELGMAMLLITHDLGLVAEYCDRVYVMYAGEIVEHGTAEEVLLSPRHPYTQGLLRASLSVSQRVDAFDTIEGQPPNLAALPSGCAFHPRCGFVHERCRTEAPPVVALGPQRTARCWLAAAKT